MEEITFQIQGSAPEPYVVRFRRNGNNISAHCTCPAGAVGQYCKHRTRIIEGCDEGIVSLNKGDIGKVVSWLPGSDLEAALRDVRDAEDRFESAKKELAAFKKKLAKTLMD